MSKRIRLIAALVLTFALTAGITSSVMSQADTAPPVIEITTPEDGAEYILNEAVVASWSARDAGSGILSATGSAPDGGRVDTASVGDKVFLVTAMDLAGNRAEASNRYRVRYKVQPTGAEGSFLESPLVGEEIQVGLFNLEGIYNVGETVRLRFQLTDIDDISVPDAHPSMSIVEVAITDGEESYTALPYVGVFQYDADTNEYILDLDTSGLSAGIYDLWIAFGDGELERVRIQLE